MPPVYRSVTLTRMDDLRDVSVQAERVYLRLALGRFSTRTGLVKYNPRDLAAEARVRPSELEAALTDLAQKEYVLRAENAPAVYLLGFCSAFAPRPVDNRRAWVADIDAFRYANLASQARKEIEDATGTAYPVATHRAPSGYPVAPPQEQEQEQEQEQNKNTYADHPTQAPVGRSAVAEQVALELKPQKPAKPKPDSAGAIRFRKAQAVASWWNQFLTPCGNAEVRKVEPAMIRVLATAHDMFERFDDCTERPNGLQGLMYWSANYSPYYGKGVLKSGDRRTWNILTWCASLNLGNVFAAYLNDCEKEKDEPVIRYAKGGTDAAA